MTTNEEWRAGFKEGWLVGCEQTARLANEGPRIGGIRYELLRFANECEHERYMPDLAARLRQIADAGMTFTGEAAL